MKDKQVEDFIDKLNKQAAKHLVKLGKGKFGKDWKKIYEGMKRRRKKRERST